MDQKKRNILTIIEREQYYLNCTKGGNSNRNMERSKLSSVATAPLYRFDKTKDFRMILFWNQRWYL